MHCDLLTNAEALGSVASTDDSIPPSAQAKCARSGSSNDGAVEIPSEDEYEE